MPASSPLRIVLELASRQPEAGAVVISAALQLFTAADPVELVFTLAGVEEPVEADGALLQAACVAYAPDLALLPEVLLVGTAEAAETESVLQVTVGQSVADDARAVILLASLAQSIWSAAEVPTSDAGTPAADLTTPDPAADKVPDAGLSEQVILDRTRPLRGQALERMRDRDGDRLRDRGSDGRLRAVVLFQQRNYWAASETVCQALREREDVDFEVVAFDGWTPDTPGLTAAFLREQGYEPRDADWLRANRSSIDVIFFDHQYDDNRPDGCKVEQLALAGIRTVYLPYAAPTGGGPWFESLSHGYNAHELAWRVYARSAKHAAIFADYCLSGNDHVAVAGLPQYDRILQANARPRPKRRGARGHARATFLWNPHWTVSSSRLSALSTFDRYIGDMLTFFGRRRDLALIVRPHFILWRTLRRADPTARLEHMVRDTIAQLPNVELDETPDYLDSFARSDAMLSDASSLIPAYLVTGRPLVYLHNPDGPGTNEDTDYFSSLYRAENWPQVESFITMVANGSDPLRAARQQALAEHFPLLDGRAGERIVDEVISRVRAEQQAGAPALVVAG